MLEIFTDVIMERWERNTMKNFEKWKRITYEYLKREALLQNKDSLKDDVDKIKEVLV